MAADGAVWTTPRVDLARALQKIDPAIGAVYRYSIDSLGRSPLCMADLVIVSHCVREIVSALPDALGDVDGLPARSDTSRPIKALAEEWDLHVTLLGNADVPLGSPTSGHDSPAVVAVPATVLDAARRVVLAHKVGSSNGNLRRSAIVLGRLDGGDVSVKIFKKSVEFFVSYAHLAGARSRDLPDESVVHRHMRVFEDTLRARLEPFFETAESIMELLAVANRRKEE